MLDVPRVTLTTLDPPEAHISDIWDGSENDTRELSQLWTGRVTFELLHPDPGKGHYMSDWRKTRTQKTSKPSPIVTEFWSGKSKEFRREAAKWWNQEE